MKIENYFDRLDQALDAAYGRAVEAGAEFDLAETESFLNVFRFGGVGYGETKTAVLPSFKFKGSVNRRRYLTVSIFRMESGRYELTSYIA